MTETYVTHRELADVAQVLDRRLDRLERSINRLVVVLGTSQVLTLAVVLLILRRVGM